MKSIMWKLNRSIFKGYAFDYQILSRALVPEIQIDRPYILISICDLDISHPEAGSSDQLVDRLNLKFDDCALGGKDLIQISDEQARSIIDFVDQYKNQDLLLIVHCMAGISRSSGTVAAISYIYDQYDNCFFDTGVNGFMPNMTVYSAIIKAYGEKIIND